ncbi:uncharacterized protein LOC124161237 [Ischnura elegans]|uniref:uncharacterized protein LOC124161237 n=1 Tax=Ischnura elegans TaxID=197161 RepID=UPI001ED8AB3F|nr:uncharacterized protein LOC124161237 [Ischnura elegans]XP_046393466.1 uncharacterized protein LOC124161237 [Ischnura elegans]
MALVMLPCDLPWWGTVQRHLANLRHAKSTADVIEGMQRLHDLCNVGLDPDDSEKPDPSVFSGLRSFLDRDMNQEERQHFLSVTLPSIVHCALQLKQWRPPSGLHFSLQQQPDRVQLSRQFLASIVSHAFFSTFPKRTPKTHPTLQDFNFTHFFRHLHRNSQKAKLWSIFHYFDQIAENEPDGCVNLSRQVLSSRQWLTLEDWVECEGPLCPLVCRHEGRLEGAEPWALRACFASPLIGGRVLSGGCSQECIQFSTHPELLGLLLWVEGLEDNEAFRVSGLQPEGSARITDPKGRAVVEPTKSEGGRGRLRLCLADAEDYGTYPMRQWEEDNLLRELNKVYLAFRPTVSTPSPTNRANPSAEDVGPRRLSPIGESFGSTPPEAEESGKDDIDQPSTEDINMKNSKCQRKPAPPPPSSRLRPPSPDCKRRFITLGSSGEQLPVRTQPLRVGVPSTERTLSRPPTIASETSQAPRLRSQYGSCHSADSAASSSADEAFHSARTSLEDDEQKPAEESKGEIDNGKADKSTDAPDDLEDEESNFPVRHTSFAERLREALNRSGASASSSSAAASSPRSRHRPPKLSSSNYSSSSSQGFTASSTSSSSYAVGISVAGSEVDDCNVWLRRGGSRGFVLEEEAELGECDDWVGDGLELEQEWLKAFRARRRTGGQSLSKREDGAGDSSRYSFSTDYGSEFEEIYEQFGHWIDSPDGPERNSSGESTRARGEAVVRFASGLLKRALSDSFAGVALDGGSMMSMHGGGREGCGEERECADGEGAGSGDGMCAGKGGCHQNVPPVARSLSMTDRLSGGSRRQRMAEHLVSLLGAHAEWSAGENGSDGEGPLPIATGNWGCGTSSSYVHPPSSPRVVGKGSPGASEPAGGGGGGGGCGDPQLKAVLQWLAASRAQAPCLIYYTCAHPRMLKLDTVCRVILDRQWTIGELTSAVLRFAQSRLESPSCDRGQGYSQETGAEGRTEANLFEDLIGTDKPVVLIETEL